MTDTALHNICIILVEPQSPGNIGMVARAMGNFGARELRLVNPCPHLHPEARKFAVGAAPLLGDARLYPDLQSALADLHLSVAATRRSGRLRGATLDVAEIPAELVRLSLGHRAGLVFGREDAGLTTAEVALCTLSAQIPTDPQLGSLNLAQAVLVFLYELSRSAPASPAPRPVGTLPSHDELEPLFRQMEQVLHRIAFLNPACPEAVMHRLREIHHRARLDREELTLLRGVWTQLAWSIRDWKGRKRGEE
jgi:tRNA/rRNA methyltransferase